MLNLTSIKQFWKVLFIEKRLPWRVQRLLTLIKINLTHGLPAALRFSIKKPKYRIVISSTYFGGIGGSEKNLFSLVQSMDNCIFYIFSENIKAEGFVPKTNNYFLNIPILFNKNFDLYYYYAGGGSAVNLSNVYPFQLKIINTNARKITDIENSFDYIIHQCNDFKKFFHQHHKHLLTFPDVKATFPRKRKKVDVPDNYFLTVFNPFDGEQKGYDLFLKAADHSHYPIVWCFNNTTSVKHHTLPEHSNIIRMPNLSQEELFYLYEHASAFVSFSTYESFGWTLAESFFSNIPIISRKTGFLDYIYNQKGIHIYENEQEVFDYLSLKNLTPPEYSYELFEQNSYKKIISKLLHTKALDNEL